MNAESFKYSTMSNAHLVKLRLTMHLRLMALNHPDRAEGVDSKQRPFYEATYEKADAELRRREQGDQQS